MAPGYYWQRHILKTKLEQMKTYKDLDGIVTYMKATTWNVERSDLERYNKLNNTTWKFVTLAEFSNFVHQMQYSNSFYKSMLRTVHHN